MMTTQMATKESVSRACAWDPQDGVYNPLMLMSRILVDPCSTPLLLPEAFGQTLTFMRERNLNEALELLDGDNAKLHKGRSVSRNICQGTKDQVATQENCWLYFMESSWLRILEI